MISKLILLIVLYVKLLFLKNPFLSTFCSFLIKVGRLIIFMKRVLFFMLIPWLIVLLLYTIFDNDEVSFLSKINVGKLIYYNLILKIRLITFIILLLGNYYYTIIIMGPNNPIIDHWLLNLSFILINGYFLGRIINFIIYQPEGFVYCTKNFFMLMM